MKRRSLVLRLLILAVAAATLPALVISIAQRSISSDALRESIEREQTELARRIAEEVNGQIRHAQSLVAMVAQSSTFSAGSRVDQYEALRNLVRQMPGLQEAMYVSATGTELVKISQAGARPALVRRAVDLRQSYIGAPFFAGNRSPTVLIAEPVKSFYNPTRSGAVLVKLSFTSLGEFMRQASVGPRGTAYIVNEKGMLLAHPDEKKVFAHTRLVELPVVKDWIAKAEHPTGLVEYAADNGEEVVGLAYPIPLLKSAVIVQQPKSDVFAPLIHMRSQFILLTLVSLVLFISLAIAVAWRILHPLRQLKLAAEQVGHGQLNVQLNIHTQDEIEELAKTFEQMALSLSELERMRKDLIHMVVHDLKMPLATILPSLECLLAGDFGPLSQPQSNFVQIARRSGQEMLTLIQNLLDVAKMEEGKVRLERELFVPSDWAENVVNNFQSVAESTRKRLTLTLGDDLLPCEGDIHLLTRALGNLISNALRHTTPGEGEIEVALYREGTHLAVQVRDNGEGISEADQQRIFERFVQGSGQRTSVQSGSGLGLSFCKMVVEAHGGRISVFSMPGDGSLFTIHLPLPEAVRAPTEPASADARPVSA